MKRTLAITVVVAIALLACTTQAQAAVSIKAGFEINEETPGADVLAIDLALANGELVYQVVAETPVSSVTGCTFVLGGPNSATQSIVQCPRTNFQFAGRNRIFLREGDDRFTAGLTFPDEIEIISGGAGANNLTGGAGPDGIFGGEAVDLLKGGEGADRLFGDDANDTLQGEGGDDELNGMNGNDTLDGGLGNDRVVGGNGEDEIIGGDGDDNLIGSTVAGSGGKVSPNSEERAAVDDLTGDLGVDQFVGSGEDRLFARDGIPEKSIGCFVEPRRTGSRATGFAEIDLKDTLLKFHPCATISDAPVNERPSVTIKGTTVKLSGRRASIRVRCTTASACRGKLALKLKLPGARKASTRYRIKGRRTKKLSVRLSAKDAARVPRGGVNATATTTEPGGIGPRTFQRTVTAKR